MIEPIFPDESLYWFAPEDGAMAVTGPEGAPQDGREWLQVTREAWHVIGTSEQRRHPK